MEVRELLDILDRGEMYHWRKMPQGVLLEQL